MGPHYETWQHSAHREVTNCNDCHVPHDNIFNTLKLKTVCAIQPVLLCVLSHKVLTLSEGAMDVVPNNCIRCHENQVQNLENGVLTSTPTSHGYGKYRWDCHRETPHGELRSLSATPNAIIPVNERIIPDWITKKLNEEKK
ncbi:MAG: hypothetical protein MK132_19135 [Lentisphaerales bacterium]|nr:hypothetical protein [Lentisphaerales bacterium]